MKTSVHLKQDIFQTEKTMMTANVLAKATDVPLYTIRHYTRIGLLKPPRKSRNNYKVYQPAERLVCVLS